MAALNRVVISCGMVLPTIGTWIISLTSLLRAFADSFRHLAGFAHANTNVAFAIANDDNRGKRSGGHP